MKKYLFMLFAFLMPFFLLVALNRHQAYSYDQFGVRVNEYSLRQGVDYFTDNWDTNYTDFTNKITGLSNYFKDINWGYQDYVSYSWVEVSNVDDGVGEWIKSIGLNLVAFFKTVGNFFANAGMFFANIGKTIYTGFGIYVNFVWFLFMVLWNIIRFAGYLIGFGYLGV